MIGGQGGVEAHLVFAVGALICVHDIRTEVVPEHLPRAEHVNDGSEPVAVRRFDMFQGCAFSRSWYFAPAALFAKGPEEISLSSSSSAPATAPSASSCTVQSASIARSVFFPFNGEPMHHLRDSPERRDWILIRLLIK